MKFAIPEISWHNRDPVLSVDFQTKRNANEPLRLATGGTDSLVLIWYVSVSESGGVDLDVAAELARHQKAVNVVRWSPSGEYLASGDDESIIFIWKQKSDKDLPNGSVAAQTSEQDEEEYEETWIIHKTLRGHMEDILDISWSANSLQLASGSVDNKLLVWDVNKGRYSTVFTDHKGFVQGVTWDPKGKLIATTSTDRVFRIFHVNTKKVVGRSSKAILPFPSDHPLHNVSVRLYHDDTLQTFYRRLQFSPDGLMIAVPAGRVESEQGKVDETSINAVYLYTRYVMQVPSCVLPCCEPALVVRWSPLCYKLRPDGPPSAIPLRHRMVLAIATRRSVMLYDTQQKAPIALISNIHYTRLTDLTWSPDGRVLVASSTDGFCSVITFADGELGEPLPEIPVAPRFIEPMDVEDEQQENEKDKAPEENKVKKSKIDSFVKFKTPKSSSKTDDPKTPIKLDVLVESAMPSWSDNSSNEIIRPTETQPETMEVVEDSEDMKLVYDDTVDNTKSEIGLQSSANSSGTDNIQKNSQGSTNVDVNLFEDGSPTGEDSAKEKTDSTPTSSKTDFLKHAKVTDVQDPVATTSVATPKAPRRVSFVTLSSPKSSKKKC